MAQILALVTSLTLLGPGALAPASPGVLERVQARRLANGWGLERRVPPGTVLLATESCEYVGWRGLVVVEGHGAVHAAVVDCQQARHYACCRLSDRDLVADVNFEALGHERASLLLWRDY